MRNKNEVVLGMHDGSVLHNCKQFRWKLGEKTQISHMLNIKLIQVCYVIQHNISVSHRDFLPLHTMRQPMSNGNWSVLVTALPCRHLHSVHGKRQLGTHGLGSLGSQHQKEVLHYIVEGDLGSHPGVLIWWALLLELHGGHLANLWPQDHGQWVGTFIYEWH